MSSTISESPVGEELTETLRQRCEELEREVMQLRQDARSGLIRAELRTEAVRAGMIDMDGLKMLDSSSLTISADGVVEGAAVLMEKARKDKPWLFSGASTSSPVAPPPAQPPRQKQAAEMNDEEYRVAREALLRRR